MTIKRHTNNGSCEKCLEITQRYPGINLTLLYWFQNLQHNVPDAHISCAGRGQDEQNRYFALGASKARWRESAHNWNAAIDIFRLKDGKADYSRKWYEDFIEPMLPVWLLWYGEKGSKFKELPHIELDGWRDEAECGALRLVE